MVFGMESRGHPRRIVNKRRFGAVGRPLAALALLGIGALSIIHAISAYATVSQHEITITTVSPKAGSVLNNDNILYEVRGNTNYADATNVFVTLKATNAVFDAMPEICMTSGVAPVSSISANRMTLTCNIGNWKQGSSFVINVTARALGPNSAQANITGDVQSDGSGITSASGQVRTISAGFSSDLGIYSAASSNTYGTMTNPVTGAVGTAVPYYWRVAVGIGSEAAKTNFTATLTITGSDNASYSSITPYPASNACADLGQPLDWNNSGSTSDDSMVVIPKYGTGGGELAYSRVTPSNDINANTNSGSCSLTGSNGVYTLSATGIDSSLLRKPTNGIGPWGNNIALPTTEVQYASGVVWLWVPDSWTTGGTNPITGSITLTASNYQTTSISGQVNSGSGDIVTNNNATDTIIPPGAWTSQWEVSPWSGQIRKLPGQSIASVQGHIPAHGNGNTVIMCSIISPSLHVDPTDSGGGLYVDQTTGATSVKIANAVEYSTAAVPNPDTSTCGAGDGPWSTTPPSDPTTITRVRAVHVVQPTDFYYVFRVAQVTNSNLTAGSQLWQYGVLSQDGGATWNRPADLNTNPSYTITALTGKQYPGTNIFHDYAEIIGAQTIPTKTTTDGKSTYSVGDTIPFKINILTNVSSGSASSGVTARAVDTLPANLAYVTGSANVAPTSVVVNADGTTTITWNIANVSNGSNTSLTYSAKVTAGSNVGVINTVVTQALNSATGASLDGGTPVAQRTSTKSINITQYGYIQISKAVDKSKINTNGSMTYTLTLDNHDPTQQSYTDLIDVLPYNGDGRTPATSFNGGYSVGDVVVNSGQTIYYSTAAPSTINLDPGDSTNGSAGSTTGSTVGWTATKPASGITALRVIGGVWQPNDPSRTLTVTLQTKGNKGGDIYTNRVGARSEHTYLKMLSPDVTTTVVPDAPNTGFMAMSYGGVVLTVGMASVSIYMLRRARSLT